MRIRWTEPAARDLTSICDFTSEHDGPEAARRIALRIYEGVSALVTFPRSGRPGRKPGTRELVFPGLPFLAIYRVQEDVVEITRILHGAQKWPELPAIVPESQGLAHGRNVSIAVKLPSSTSAMVIE